MAAESEDLKAVNEIGKIFNSLVDKKIVSDFFLESGLNFACADQGLLFLAGKDDQIWLEASAGAPPGDFEALRREAQLILQEGKPVIKDNVIFAPLFVRNSVIGISCFLRKPGAQPFMTQDLVIISDLSAQVAVALKNILLFEATLQMERLAAIGRVTAMVMHEIKNIMQLAIFAEEWLERGFEKQNPKYIERGLAGIKKTLRDLDGFVHEILSLNRNYEVTPQKMNMAELLKELGTDLQDKASQFSVKLDFQVEEGFPEVDGEPRALHRALVNMVKNAIEVSDKEDAYIRIRIRSRDEFFYEITVEDNGKGMTDEVKAKLFQLFFTTKGERGTGLGLMIIDRTVKAHHGKIEVSSEVGKGTTFTLILPKVIHTEA